MCAAALLDLEPIRHGEGDEPEIAPRGDLGPDDFQPPGVVRDGRWAKHSVGERLLTLCGCRARQAEERQCDHAREHQ